MRKGRVQGDARVGALVAALALAAAACGGDGAFLPTPTPTPTATALGPTATPIRTPTPSAPPTPTPTSSGAPTATPVNCGAVTTTARFLTGASDTVDYWPRFAPSGDAVLFSRQIGSAANHFFTVSTSGGAPTPFPMIPDSVGATRADWMWSTNEIAFTGTTTGSVQSVWIVAGDGSGLRRVDAPGTGTIVDYPSWYPDGQHVAAVDYGSDPRNPIGVLRKIDVQSGENEPLTDLSQIYAGEPSVSPDGASLLFPGQPNTGRPYNQDNNLIYLLVQGVPQLLDSGQGRTPDYSPDGKLFTFESARCCADGNYAIFIEDAAGGVPRQITDCSLNANHGVWSPDGAAIAFSGVLPERPGDRGIALVPSGIEQ